MENIRCLIVDIPQLMLADIVEKIIDAKPGVEVVGRLENENAILNRIQEGLIDVVIHGLADLSFSSKITDLLRSSSDIVSVGICNDGRRICVCVDDIGPDEMVGLIKDAATILKLSRSDNDLKDVGGTS